MCRQRHNKRTEEDCAGSHKPIKRKTFEFSDFRNGIVSTNILISIFLLLPLNQFRYYFRGPAASLSFSPQQTKRINSLFISRIYLSRSERNESEIIFFKSKRKKFNECERTTRIWVTFSPCIREYETLFSYAIKCFGIYFSKYFPQSILIKLHSQ